MGLMVSVFGSGADWSVSTLLLFTAVFILTTYYIRNRRPANFPPGPWTLPVVGNMHNLDHHRMHLNFMQVGQQRGGRIYFPSDVFVAFFPHVSSQLAETYGNVFSVQLGQEWMVVLNGPAMLKEALVTQGDGVADRPSLQLNVDASRGLGEGVTENKSI